MTVDESESEPEIGRPSLWFLRGIAAAVTLIVLWFLVDAIPGF